MTTDTSTRAAVLDSEPALAALRADWDRLAVLSGRPLAAPAFGLAWWRHCAPRGASLRAVVVSSAGRVVGIAPYFAGSGRFGRTDYRLLGSGLFHRIGPLAEPGSERLVASEVWSALCAATPAPALVTLEGVGRSPDWHALLASSDGGRLRPRRYVSSVHHAPTVALAGATFDEWLGSKRPNFRQQARSLRRRAESRGARCRQATAETLEADVRTFSRLHHQRFDETRAGTFLNDRVERMLVEAASELLADARFRLFVLELEGTAAGAQIFAAGGGEVSYWNGGFDPAFGDLRPGYLLMLHAIEDALARSERRLDLGGGATAFKLRFADGDDPIAWGGLMPRTVRYPLTRALLLPAEATWLARAMAKRLLRRRG